MKASQTLAEGRYLLVDRLGEGGMATVFQAFDQRLQVWRAIKVLHPSYTHYPSLLQRFDAEARTMAALEHPNIVRVYDVGQDGRCAYIVMELVRGGTVFDWVHNHGRMPAKMAVDIVLQVANAIMAAHSKGVVHRDIKPVNILVSVDGQCRVSVFGIARVGDVDPSGLTRSGIEMGTYGYMAPEQRRDAKTVDVRADVYSLAATLFHLLTARVPHDLFAHDREPAILDRVRPDLARVIGTATAWDVAERFATVADFVAALTVLRPDLAEVSAEVPALASGSIEDPAVPTKEDYRKASPLAASWAPPGGTVIPVSESPVPEQTLPDRWPKEFPGERGQGFSVESRDRTLYDFASVDHGDSRRYLKILTALSLLLALAFGGAGVWVMVRTLTDETGSDQTRLQPGSVPIIEASSAPTKPEPPVIDRPASPVPSAPSESVSVPVQVEPAPPMQDEPTIRQCLRVVPPSNVRMGQRVNFSATLCDEDGRAVNLHYRGVGATKFRSVKMPLVVGKHFGQVDVDERFAEGIEYWVEAGRVAHGSSNSPLRLSLMH